MALLAGSSIVVDLCGPLAAVAAVVRDGGERNAGPTIGGEAESECPELPGNPGDRNDNGLGVQRRPGPGQTSLAT